MMTWFMRGLKKDDENKVIAFRNQKLRTNISLERLSRPKKQGGRLLNRIMDIFSANKAKMLIRLQNPQFKSKSCYHFLKIHINQEYVDQEDKELIHPLFLTRNKSSVRHGNCEWMEQAMVTYRPIKKDISIQPHLGQIILDLETKEETVVDDDFLAKNTNPIFNSIPIRKKMKITTSTSRYSLRKKKTVRKTVRVKARKEKWEQVSITFPKCFNSRKIKSKDIISHANNGYVPKKGKSVWTQKQQKWINEGIPLEKLLTTHTNNIEKIEDFKTKYFMIYWNYLKPKSCICERKDLSVDHILNEWPIIEKVEHDLFSMNSLKSPKKRRRIEIPKLSREERMKNQYLPDSDNYGHCWMVNWCLWKTFWSIKIEENDQPLSCLIGQLNNNEHIFLKLHMSKMEKYSEKKKKRVLNNIQKFRYYKLNNGLIDKI